MHVEESIGLIGCNIKYDSIPDFSQIEGKALFKALCLKRSKLNKGLNKEDNIAQLYNFLSSLFLIEGTKENFREAEVS